MAVPIDKTVPIPVEHPNQKYPWQQMEVGDSFLSSVKSVKYISGNFALWERRLGFEFTARKEGDGVRVWRVK